MVGDGSAIVSPRTGDTFRPSLCVALFEVKGAYSRVKHLSYRSIMRPLPLPQQVVLPQHAQPVAIWQGSPLLSNHHEAQQSSFPTVEVKATLPGETLASALDRFHSWSISASNQVHSASKVREMMKASALEALAASSHRFFG